MSIYVPEGQFKHKLEVVAGWYLPSVHERHVSCGTSVVYWPAGHALHGATPSPAKVPAVHAVCVAEPSPET